jgi:hypothetical protein
MHYLSRTRKLISVFCLVACPRKCVTRFSGSAWCQSFPPSPSNHGQEIESIQVLQAGISRGMYWYILRHPIMYWYTMGHPISASISCTIPKSELGYYIPPQSIYWYILGQNSGPRPKLEPCRLLPISNRGPKFGHN